MGVDVPMGVLFPFSFLFLMENNEKSAIHWENTQAVWFDASLDFETAIDSLITNKCLDKFSSSNTNNSPL